MITPIQYDIVEWLQAERALLMKEIETLPKFTEPISNKQLKRRATLLSLSADFHKVIRHFQSKYELDERLF